MERRPSVRQRRSSNAAEKTTTDPPTTTKETTPLAQWIKYLMETSISEMTMFQQLWAAIDLYGHEATVKAITVMTLLVLYLYVSGTSIINLDQFDPVVVDHAIAAVALSGPLVYLIMLNMYYSDVETPVGLSLLTLRVTCCCIVGAAMTIFVTEMFSRRVVLSLVLMGYGGWGFFYAWSVPLWRWYMYDVRQYGLIAYLPAGLQDTLLRMTLLEWLTDTSFIDNLRQYFPFFLPLNANEQQRVVESLPNDTQAMMTKPGLIYMLSPSLQDMLLPDPAVAAPPPPPSSSVVTVVDGSRDSRSVVVPSTVGFEFQKVDALVPTAAAATSTSIMTDILNEKITSTITAIVQLPSPKLLNRTAAISTFLFALQLRQSTKARVHFLLLLRVLSMAVLGTIACASVSLRAVQVITAMPSTRKYLALIQDIWVRQQSHRRTLTHGGGSDPTAKSVEVAAKYGLTAAAILWAIRKLRQ
ncbi:Aste57867_13020 [Aphanomyces stellatus]|uniref:Aste57867_13020 protein n=1 Tax=Aphanomyces stellatus TaxID=120398 RepID=A0A485KX30_9STRA|nr:hypothetical protein As57867_012972 [Aphanomyces stellatus]VFT89865.1 Aste57867_13020 [Aphanomyces stellatus]